MLNRINELQEQINELVSQRIYSGKKFNSLLKEKKDLIIEYNKSNNIYFHENYWIDIIYYAISHQYKNSNLTGNALTKAMAEELNKIDGVACEEEYCEETKTLNYFICVITPYSVYHFVLSRGYGKQADFSRYVYHDNTNKTRSHIEIPQKHIAELIYGWIDYPDKYDNKYDELVNEFGRKFLDKTSDKLDVDKIVKDYQDYLEEQRRVEEEKTRKSNEEFDKWCAENGISFKEGNYND